MTVDELLAALVQLSAQGLGSLPVCIADQNDDGVPFMLDPPTLTTGRYEEIGGTRHGTFVLLDVPV
jgi:hypothetical protein